MISEHTNLKYVNDAVYHALVNWMVAFLVEGSFTASEISQAAELAQQLADVQRLISGLPD